jgi:hypothetical protein
VLTGSRYQPRFAHGQACAPADRACPDQRAELAVRWAAWRAEKAAREQKDNGVRPL